MFFCDIHMHLLFGTDDGAKTKKDMFAIADAAYNEGTRLICATPHFSPQHFGDNRESALEAFDELLEYCQSKYPDLKLILGNELFYMHDSISWLKNGHCKTMGNTRAVLVEFGTEDSEDYIAEAVDRLLNSGYIPIIAHAERYRKLSLGRLWALKQNGALVQTNTEGFLSRFSFNVKKRLKLMLSEKMVDFVSSDAHGVSTRPPQMDKCYEIIKQKYGVEYADALCCNNALKLLCTEEE